MRAILWNFIEKFPHDDYDVLSFPYHIKFSSIDLCMFNIATLLCFSCAVHSLPSWKSYDHQDISHNIICYLVYVQLKFKFIIFLAFFNIVITFLMQSIQLLKTTIEHKSRFSVFVCSTRRISFVEALSSGISTIISISL